ncbi:MAG: 50S ribosomal protein L32 [Candidatus Paceibacterota bacterium]
MVCNALAQISGICNISAMVNRMRSTRSHTGNRRSHHGLFTVRFSKCQTCQALHQSHRICMNCGSYNGRKVIDLAAKVAKKAKKIATEKK